ncbi:FG-GAP repeat protein [Streptomyces lichenis]|uniref:FG-GAP repeat protein n=1 Tax=Streptomyces lichenis TaxID=2306967 RepID=A0ABT0I4F8_9ACTN|nr:FG-GAP repeat protein [Streptomyces lichenis]MCK8676167.1 FG-GAP repeat protein [Streptomyces lichenis]
MRVPLKGPFSRAGKYGSRQPLGGYGYLDVAELVAGNVDGKGGTDVYIVGRDLYQNTPARQQPVFLHRSGTSWTSFADRPVHPLRVPDDGGGQTGPGLSVVGDFGKDGFGDLAVGRGLENTDRGRGSVIVHYGSADGRPKRMQTLSQDTAGVPGASENDGHFGSALDAGDVDGDGYADLAAGAYGEDAGRVRNTGMVTVLRGGPGGLTGKGATAFDQSTANVADTPEQDGAFGRTLKPADYTRDGRADLLVDVNEELDGKDRWGLVQILKGSPSGTTTSGAKHFTTDSLKLKYRTLGTYFAG